MGSQFLSLSYSLFPIAKTIYIAQIFKLTHREQNLFSSLQNFKHIFCFAHILQFMMALFKCTEHSSLHKTQHKVTCLRFKITLHEIISIRKWALKDHRWALLFPTTMEDVGERRGGRGRVRIRGGGRVRGRAGRGGHGQRRQLSNEISILQFGCVDLWIVSSWYFSLTSKLTVRAGEARRDCEPRSRR